MRALVCTLIATAVVVACATVGVTPCDTAADCNGSSESMRAGRCAPELACDKGTCHAECLGLCKIEPENRFPQPPCGAGGICNQPVKPRAGAPVDAWRCTRRTIHCETPTDCPVQKPASDGEWTCDDTGVCRFPGFAFDFD